MPHLTIHELMQIAHAGTRTIVMGILNVTPDSFSDGGRWLDPDKALAHARVMAEAGADILDVGGESTRPGAEPVSIEEELRRVVPVVLRIKGEIGIPVSIDTRKSAVASAALTAGAVLVNDISAMRSDPQMAATVAGLGVPVCLMHMQGLPATMQQNPHYADVVSEVKDWLAGRARSAQELGIRAENILLDPGFGFGKTVPHNLKLLSGLSEVVALGYPVISGTSRKSMIGAVVDGMGPEARLEGTAATVALSISAGAAIVRVHDVRAMVRVARMADAVVRG